MFLEYGECRTEYFFTSCFALCDIKMEVEAEIYHVDDGN